MNEWRTIGSWSDETNDMMRLVSAMNVILVAAVRVTRDEIDDATKDAAARAFIAPPTILPEIRDATRQSLIQTAIERKHAAKSTA